MKQLIHSLQDREILFIEVPKEANEFFLDEYQDIYWKKNKRWVMCPKLIAPSYSFDGYWEIIGELNSITEEQAAKLVDKYQINGIIYYDSYGNPWWLYTANESLQSLLKSLGIETVNPLGDKPLHYDYEEMHQSGHYLLELKEKRQKEIDLWQAAQAKVWEKVLILVKNK